MIDDIKRDREAGTDGPWSKPLIKCAWLGGQKSLMSDNPHLMPYIISAIHDGTVDVDARRVARVPDMEAALIAAEEMANGAEGNVERDGIVYAQVPVHLIAAYRAATGAS